MSNKSDDYADEVSRLSVARICASLGWQGVNASCLDTLSHLLRLSVHEIGKSSMRNAELSNRTDPNLKDVTWTLQRLGFLNIDDSQYSDLADFLTVDMNSGPSSSSSSSSVTSWPPLRVPKFPAPISDTNLNFLKPGSREVLVRKMHVNDYFPPMYPEMAETEDENAEGRGNAENEATEENETAADGDVADMEAPIREISSVMMTSSGFISPARQGRLPDARNPVLPAAVQMDRKSEDSGDGVSALPATQERDKKKRKEEARKQSEIDEKKELSDPTITSGNAKKLAIFQKRKSSAPPPPPPVASPSPTPPPPPPPTKTSPPPPPQTKTPTTSQSRSSVKMDDMDDIMDSVIERGIQESKSIKKKRKKMMENAATLAETPLMFKPDPITTSSPPKLKKTKIVVPPPMVKMPPAPSPPPPRPKTASPVPPVSTPTPPPPVSVKLESKVKPHKKESSVVVPPPPPPAASEKLTLPSPAADSLKIKGAPVLNNPLIPRGGQLFGFPSFGGDEPPSPSSSSSSGKKDKKDKEKKKHKKDKDKEKKKKKEKREIMEPLPLLTPDKPTVSTSSVPKIKIKLDPSESSAPPPSLPSASAPPPSTPKTPKIIFKAPSKTPKPTSSSSAKSSSSSTTTTVIKKSKMDKKDFLSSGSSPMAATSSSSEKKPKKEKTKKTKNVEGAGSSGVKQQQPQSSPSTGMIVSQTVGHYVDADGNQIWICPACGKQDDGSPMIGCDECDDWYHWACVGINSEPAENQDWFCTRCMAKKTTTFLKKKKH